MKPQFTEDDRKALIATVGMATVMLLFSIWFTIDMGRSLRPSFIEVDFGEFQTGRLSQFSEVQNEQVAQRRNPSETETPEPVEEVPEPEETPTNPSEENTKPVELPDEVEDVPTEETIETPKTEVIDPTQNNEQQTEEVIEVPPKAVEAEESTEGADESGDPDGAIGDMNADQGVGTDEDKSAPYQLEWEGDIERAPMVQPLPVNTANSEAVITVRFEVRPDGTVGRIIPIKKMNLELEQEVMRTLRSWRFSRLPGGVPQQSQWGVITFRFVFD